MSLHNFPETVILASGSMAWLDDEGKVTHIEKGYGWGEEGPTCTLCDGLGHGYPGAGPCPLEMRGWEDAEQDRIREAHYGY
jgi:hypothetical protein